MEGSGPAPGDHAESVESRSILGLVSLTTPLRAVWLTEHTRKSEPGLAGLRGKIQRRHPGGREIDRSGRLVRNDLTVLSRLAAVLEAPDPDFAIVTP
jgi:hypothetical protein